MGNKHRSIAAGFLMIAVSASGARAATITFFSSEQGMTLSNSGAYSDTTDSMGYQFTRGVDKDWAIYQGGPPVGRYQQVEWPTGLHVQSITAGPQTGSGADVLLARADGEAFHLDEITVKLLANNAGSGGAFELMPLDIAGEDAFNDPIYLDCTGYAGHVFTYDLSTPAALQPSFYAYKIHLLWDWALMGATVTDAFEMPPFPDVPEPASLVMLGLGAGALVMRRRREG